MSDRFITLLTEDEKSKYFSGLAYGFLRTNKYYADSVVQHVYNKHGYYYVICVDGDGWGSSEMWLNYEIDKISRLWFGLYNILPHKDSCIVYADEIIIIEEEDISQLVKDYFKSADMPVTISVRKLHEIRDYKYDIRATSLRDIRKHKETLGRGEIYYVD